MGWYDYDDDFGFGAASANAVTRKSIFIVPTDPAKEKTLDGVSITDFTRLKMDSGQETGTTGIIQITRANKKRRVRRRRQSESIFRQKNQRREPRRLEEQSF